MHALDPRIALADSVFLVREARAHAGWNPQVIQTQREGITAGFPKLLYAFLYAAIKQSLSIISKSFLSNQLGLNMSFTP